MMAIVTNETTPRLNMALHYQDEIDMLLRDKCFMPFQVHDAIDIRIAELYEYIYKLFEVDRDKIRKEVREGFYNVELI